ncbi:Sugar transporter [Candidatus Rhodobacter oscarellae]|uniref:Sugar transporter n=1 Tax=Candidatus Rhodobacter oscarellae TaxID=1675527 RepID=A0A0J9E0U2_9RHOB|nr:MFS transporter [Candidatus Rhodobacter lobularis]KMW56287.1 Sugar transporter [Candidatus Rhodobacter lobularis]
MALTQGQKAGWGLADMGIVVFVMIKQLLILTFLTTVMGVPAAVAGAITTGVLVFDIVTDPLIGYFSDRTNTRWGRRAPWMFLGAIVMTLGCLGMFNAPQNPEGGLIWFAAMFVVATIGFTMLAIPYGATAAEMTQDPKERSAMVGWRMVFASVGILIGGGVLPGLAAGMGYPTAMLISAPLIVLPIWASLWLTRRAPKTEAPSTLSLGAALRLVLSNPPFTWLVVLYGVMTLAVAMITAGLPLAALYLINDAGSSALSGAANGLGTMPLLFAGFVIGSILSQAVWVMLSGRLGKTGALILGLCLYMAVLAFLYTRLPSVNVTAMAGIFVLAGMTNGAYQQIPWAMWPDLIDATRREQGGAVEGAFSAIWLFGQKVANALAPGLVGVILGAYGWQEATGGAVVEQGAGALQALRMTVTLVPIGIFVLSILGLLAIYRPRARAVVARP